MPHRTPATRRPSSARQLRKLDDWRIRAGLYGDHHAPFGLEYMPDKAIADLEIASNCASTLIELKPYSRSLLKAPTRELRALAKRVDKAALTYLRSCAGGKVVRLHHAKASLDQAMAEVNLEYARSLGLDPEAYDTRRCSPDSSESVRACRASVVVA
jgi:hypothetical protein